MKLERPLVSFDLEVTGLDPTEHRIVEIAAIKLMPDGSSVEKVTLVNPGCKIPPDATAVHGISDKDVENAPLFKQLAVSLLKFFSDCDLTGYNIAAFDIPFLKEEFARCGICWPATQDLKVLDAFAIVTRQESRDLSWALKFYTDRELGKDAHSALPDAQAALDVVLAQAEKYLHSEATPAQVDTLQRSPDWMDSTGKFRSTQDGIVVNFGKHKEQPLNRLASGYLRWMLKESFPTDAKEIARKELDRRVRGTQ